MIRTRRGVGRHGPKALAVLVICALVTACGGDDGGGATTAETTVPPSATDGEEETNGDDDDGEEGGGSSAFDDLVEQARQSDGRIRQALDSYTAEEIEARESAFEARFGFPLFLENEPGHQSQDIPAKVIQSGQAGRGVVDMSEGNSTNFVPVFQQGFMRTPDWDTLVTEWPIIDQLRQDVLPAVNDDGELMSDYCMLQAHLPWVPVYNTERVSPEEIEGLVWEDLTDAAWQNRLVLDANGAGLFVFPFAPDWDADRLEAFAAGLGANDPTIVSGGSSGVIQAILSGEGDMGISVSRVVEAQKAIGAPLDYVIPNDFLPVSHRSTCMMEPGVGDPAMVELYWAWLNAEFIYEIGASGEPTDPRLGPDDVEYFEIARRVQDAGLGEEQFAYARTVEEDLLIPEYREIAVTGQSG